MTDTNINRLLSKASSACSAPMFATAPEAYVDRSQLLWRASPDKLLPPDDQFGGGPGFIKGLLLEPLWLHVRWQSNCYFLYAEYYFEAWVTKTADAGGARVPVGLIEIKWRHGGTRGHEAKENADMIGKSDRVYANGIVCESDICVHGIATNAGVTWSTSSPNPCIP